MLGVLLSCSATALLQRDTLESKLSLNPSCMLASCDFLGPACLELDCKPFCRHVLSYELNELMISMLSQNNNQPSVPPCMQFITLLRCTSDTQLAAPFPKCVHSYVHGHQHEKYHVRKCELQLPPSFYYCFSCSGILILCSVAQAF